MARLSRIGIPGVTQRDNRRLPVFFGDDDRRLYLDLVREGCIKARVTCLAWCLMDNHVHLVLVPQHEAGLREALGEAHRRYSRAINFRHGWRGYLVHGTVLRRIGLERKIISRKFRPRTTGSAIPRRTDRHG